MQLTIDNLDGGGALDYTAALGAEPPARVLRRLNRPAELRAALVATDPGFVVPAAGARVLLARRDGSKLFTGYAAAPLEHEYLGWGPRGPVYRYSLVALSDESLLDRKTLPARAPFVARTAGGALKQLAEDLLPGAFDTSAVADAATLPWFSISPQKTWSEHAAELGLLARASYCAHDGALVFQPVGATVHTLDETAPGFATADLKFHPDGQIVNDITVIGRIEPRAYVKDYFLGDGLTLQFDLSHVPFTRYSATVAEEEYTGSALAATRWQIADPASALSVGSGKLQVAGGTGVDGQTTVAFAENVELGGVLLLQHGEVNFTAASDGILGGLYSASPVLANCLAGFRVTPSGGQSAIQALVGGALTGTPVTTVAGHRYALATRLYCLELFRARQVFHSSAHPAGSGRGGGTVAASVRCVLEVHDIDPANPGSLAAPSIVLFDGVLAAPAYVAYVLVNSRSLHCALAFTRVVRMVDAEVRSAIPGQGYRTRLAGAISEGAECGVYSTPELQFFSPFPPVQGEKIAVRYRGQARALARITDPASIAALAHNGDDGVRGAVRNLAAPAPLTSADCENAALALLDDSTQPAWAGEYQVWSDFLPAGDVFPGDAVTVDAPSQGAVFSAIVREVALEVADPEHDRSRYTLRVSNDAAAPLAFDFDPARLDEPLDVTATTATAGASFIADLPDAEITDCSSTTITIDAGTDPPAGGGFEVRRSDYGWGQESDRNLAGRFTSRSFALPRLARIQDYYLRQYDASSPPHYSRYSTALHLDYPL